MIPAAYITDWRRRAPWSTDAQVEQDLVPSSDETSGETGGGAIAFAARCTTRSFTISLHSVSHGIVV